MSATLIVSFAATTWLLREKSCQRTNKLKQLLGNVVLIGVCPLKQIFIIQQLSVLFMTTTWQKRCYTLGIFGALQFMVLTLLAMLVYPGGTLHEPNLEQYSFLYNFFSDLGRTETFDGRSNLLTHFIFKTTLTVGGICLIVFFLALPQLFTRRSSKNLALLTMVFGLLAGVSYIGIGQVPWNVNYWGHRFYVRVGFLAFLAMTFFYTVAILVDKNYPKRYAAAMGVFAIVLTVQIAIMFYATNAWHSNEALYLQAVAQKVVVYAEILCLLYQSYGALLLSKRRAQSS